MNPAQPPQTAHIGDLLAGKYRIEGMLGEGGMGVVYAARHELLGQRVALKLLRPSGVTSPEAVARFLAEARNASRIQSDHVAHVLDMGLLEGGSPYMAIEYLEGADLASLLRGQSQELPGVRDVVDWLLETIEAIAHAHALGIVHRDLKPSNLFLARRPDGTTRIKVLDFGISKAIDPTGGAGAGITATHTLLGSPSYMSPEQLLDSKRVDGRADIWALGVVAYELLTRTLPFHGENVVALFDAIQTSDPKPLRALRAEIPSGLEAAVLRCLRRSEDDRFATVADLGTALAPYGTEAATWTLEGIGRIASSSQPSRSRPPRPRSPETISSSGAEPSPPPWSSASGWPSSAKGGASASRSAAGRTTSRSSKRVAAAVMLTALPVAAIGVGGYWLTQRPPPTSPTASAGSQILAPSALSPPPAPVQLVRAPPPVDIIEAGAASAPSPVPGASQAPRAEKVRRVARPPSEPAPSSTIFQRH